MSLINSIGLAVSLYVDNCGISAFSFVSKYSSSAAKLSSAPTAPPLPNPARPPFAIKSCNVSSGLTRDFIIGGSSVLSSSKGIKGIGLAPNDQIVSLSIIDNDKNLKNGKKNKDDKAEIKAKEKFILSITENGFGKKTSHFDYRVTNRGGKGIIGIINSPRNGNISSSFPVFEGDEILISTNKGRVIRVAVKEIRTAGRNTQGVRIIKLSGEEKVVSADKIDDNLV